MPGIVGLITKMPRELAEPQLLRMVKSMCHEKFYVSGTWIDESHGIYVGWIARRGSFSDGMPLRNNQATMCLVFSGEEFSPPDTIARFHSNGNGTGGCEASYLIRQFEDDPECLTKLNGRFHGLLVDQARGTAIIFNDRYGMHRLYFHEANDAFYFAAEAKAILAVRPELRKADPQGLGEFVSCGCVLENRTLFHEIRLLPPGSSWQFRNAKLEERSLYFDPREWEEQSCLDYETYYSRLREVFQQNLPRYFSGRESIGISLTGGLDTRMILAWRKPSPDTLPCYSFGGSFRDSQDVLLARHLARLCDQPYKVLSVGDEFLKNFGKYAERTVYLTDGSVDVSHSPDLYVNELAREIAPVRMTGNYGGEVLRRVRAFKPVEQPEGLFNPEFLAHVRAARNTYAAQLSTHPLSFAVFRQAPWHHFGLLSLEQSQLSLRSPYLDNDFVQTVFRAPDSACSSNDISLRLIGDGDPRLLSVRTDRGLAGGSSGIPSAISRNVLEFSFKAEYAYDYGMPQWVAQLDHLFSPMHLERLFLGRHKFYHFRVWYRDALSKYVKVTLLDPRTLSRPYVERRGLENIVHSHLKGNRNHTSAIHKILTLELLHRSLLDAN